MEQLQGYVGEERAAMDGIRLVLSQFSGRTVKARRQYEEYVEEGISKESTIL